MDTKKLFLAVGGTVAAALLLVGGVALGNVLADDDSTGASREHPGSRPVAAATPVPDDPSREPGVGTDGATPPPTWHEPSVHQARESAPVPSGSDPALAADLAALYDPETGIDTDTTRDPWEPPTTPAFDPETEEVDPEAPAERADGVEVVPDDEVEHLFLPPLSTDLLFRFVDPCAGDAPGGDGEGGECPDGIGGTIVLTGAGDPPEPLQIMRQMYTSIGVPLELRCAPLGFASDGTHRAIFATNNPADFTIRYWLSTEPDDVHEIEWSTPESERERWLERRASGEPTHASMHTGVHNCPEIPGLFPGRHVTFEIHGVDDMGTEATAKIYFTTGTEVAGGASVGRPPASFSPLGPRDDRGVITVPYNERTEQVYVASLPRGAGARATTESCTDIENAVLAGTRRLDGSLYDWDVTTFPRTPDDGFEPGIESSVLTRFVGEEGTTYDICVWVTKPPTRSFDKPPVVMREVLTVRAPVRWRTRLHLAGGHSDVPLEAGDVSVRPTNWGWTSASSWPDVAVRAGAFMLDGMVLLRDSGSSPVPPITLLEITGPGGATSEVSVPTPTSCVMSVLCPRGGLAQYDVAIPGPSNRYVLCGGGPCEPPTSGEIVGNLRLVVETYAGPGGPPQGGLLGADGWQISRDPSFPAARADAPPPEPRLDLNSVVLDVVGGSDGIDGGRPGLRFRASFDRPVQVTAVPRVIIGRRCPVGPPAQTTDGSSNVVDLRFEGLCWGSTYGMDLIATDAAGNVLDLRTEVDGVSTGRGAWSLVDTPTVGVEEYTVRVTVDQIGEGFGATYLRVGPVEVHPHGAGVACLADGEPRELTVRNAGGRPITFSDPLPFDLEVRQAGDGRDCGDRAHGEGLRIAAGVGLDDLADGSATIHYTHEDGTDVTLEIVEVVWAE